MARAYIFRHQHGGFDTSHVFLRAPTDEQMVALSARADACHGVGWAIAAEVTLIDDDSVPLIDVPDSGATGSNSGGASIDIVCSGVGTVSGATE